VGAVFASDDDLPDDTLTYTLVGHSANVFALDPISGTLTVNDSQTLDYETTPTFVLTVRVTDSEQQQATAPITVSLTNVNEPPQVDNAQFTVNENAPVDTFVGQVVATDPEQAPGTLAYAITGGNADQAFALSPSGEITVQTTAALDYETRPVYNLTVRVTDNGNLTDTATIRVSLQDVNDDPQAVDDVAQVVEDSELNRIYVRGNDTDQDGDTLTVVGVSEAQHGIPSIAANNLFVYYTPDDDYFGTDTFEYTVHDGRGGWDVATVRVTVTGVNDRPIAVDDWASTPEDQPVQIDVVTNDEDVDGNPDPTTVEVLDGPDSGRITNVNPNTGVITYRPNANWNGSDSFTYRIRDDGSPAPRRWSEVPATVSVTTDPVPDFPVADAGPDQTVFSNDLVTLDGSGSEDPDGGDLRYFWSYHGDIPLVLSDPNAIRPTFTAPFAPSNLLFSLTVLDEDNWGDTDTVEVEVRSRPPVANAGPDLYVYTGEQAALSGAGSSDPDGDENLEYVWAQVDGGPPVTLLPNASVVAPTFTAPLSPTVLTFRLLVYDSFGTHDATLSEDDVNVIVRDPSINELYLPQIARYHCPQGGNCGPDLVVQRLTVTRNDIEVVIANQGSRPVAAVGNRFYVDVYINPGRRPTSADNWWDIRPPEPSGIKWRVTPPQLNGLVPGGTLVLNRSNMLAAPYSRVTWPLSGGTAVYAQVDPYLNAVAETNESNNLLGPKRCCP
jgi:hypothetical protein